MAIKDHPSSKGSEGDAWEGPWGSISPTPHSVSNLRLERQAEHTEKYLYPYRGFSKSLWIGGELETVQILAGRDRITLTGRSLERLFLALDSEQLQRVSETPDAHRSDSETVIHSIVIENLDQESIHRGSIC